MSWNRPPLTVEQILAWADDHFQRYGEWPKDRSGTVAANLNERWRNLDNALRYGLRGLEAGSSLARLLEQHRGVRNVKHLPALTTGGILAWAQQHHDTTGSWPNEHSGPVPTAPGEVWYNVNAALRRGDRGLPGGSSLAKLLAEGLGVRTQVAVPRLTVKRILAWASAWRERTGRWPRHDSGPIPEAPGETWQAVESALRLGNRGLRGGDSLYALLKRYRYIPGQPSKSTWLQQAGPVRRSRGRPQDVAQRQKALLLRAQGLTLKQIGRRLGCSKQNVSQLLRTSEQNSPAPAGHTPRR